MRKYLILPLAAVMVACSVSKDDTNDSVTMTYNEDVAENAADATGAAIENAAADVANEAREIGDDIENVDVDVDAEVKTDGTQANAN
jgi:DNA-binding protein